MTEAFEHAQTRAREMVLESQRTNALGFSYKMSETPPEYAMPAPELGEHSDELLREIGYDDAQLAKLRAAGVIV
jgi:crotonobetainyl-CoA:carnitine CoA-transferase CaiB-like acyl-CoA transferase